MFDPTHEQIVSYSRGTGMTYDQAKRKLTRDKLDAAIMQIEDADKQPNLRALLQFMAEKICNNIR